MSAKKESTEIKIGLALSGGGVRAAAFHAGVLRYLAEKEQLEMISHVSSVSGGSLFIGLVFNNAQYKWPSSSEYLSAVFPQIRELLTSKSLQRSAIFNLLLNPLNWMFIFSRANVIAQTIKSLWGINVLLGQVTPNILWSINGTAAETGRRFRFKNGRMGDYEIGYADATKFPLASAMAVSAAFPGGIGPLVISANEFQWFKKPQWDAHDEKVIKKLPFNKLHLYDGGLYDNLGIEPIFDMGTQQFKDSEHGKVNYFVVSDAGAALSRSSLPHMLNPLRFKRIADIAFDQTRSLRVRSFVNFLQKNPSSGAYLQIGSFPIKTIKRLMRGREKVAEQLLNMKWLQENEIEAAANYPTTLCQMTTSDFDLLAKHGWETARWNDLLLGQGYINQSET